MDNTYEDRWPDSLLDHLRSVGDPLADAAVSDLIAKPGGPAAAHGADLVAALSERAQAGSGACRELLAQVNIVPRWASFPHMALSYPIGLTYPVAASLAVLCGSLPTSYAGALGAKVLVRTGNLTRSTRRRIFETAEFLYLILRSSGPAPGTSAHRALVRLRLIHAHIRTAMQRRSDWDLRWGLPVNQEDYGATLLVFSLVFVRSIQQLGVPISEVQRDSIHHGWRYAGYVMGIDDRLLTESPAAEAALYAKIIRRQQHPDADSCALTDALFTAMAWQPPFLFPPQALQALCRELLGHELADRLSVPRVARWSAIPAATRVFHKAQHILYCAVPGAGKLARTLGTGLLDAVIDDGLAKDTGSMRGATRGIRLG